MKVNYGLNGKDQAFAYAGLVCDVLGHGKNNNAEWLLLETACAETQLGDYPDQHPEILGVGLTQFDQIAFDDVLLRVRTKDIESIQQVFGINIFTLELKDLAYDPMLAFIFTRLKYKFIPQEIPKTLEDRAKYWKQHYNTVSGKGTIEHYIESANRILKEV